MALTKIDDRGLKTPIDLLDNEKIRFGTGNDLEVYHDGSDSYITNTGTGNLIIKGDDVHIQGSNGENMANFNEDGGVQLRYNGTTKFETITSGVRVTSGDLELLDNTGSTGRLLLGNGGDLQIYHDGTNTQLRNQTGSFLAMSDTFDFRSWSSNETMIKGVLNGAVELYYDNSKKLDTNSWGVKGYGYFAVDGSSGYAYTAPDNAKVSLGTGNDLQLWHDSSNSYITNTTGVINIQAKQTENSIVLNPDGAVELYHNNSKKFETTSTGAILTSGAANTTSVRFGNTANRGLTISTYQSAGNNDSGVVFNAADSENNGYAATLEFDLGGVEFGRFDGNYDIFKLASACNGITFNGDWAAANRLNDYEEGEIPLTCSSGGLSITSNNGGYYSRYIKIGHFVHIQFYIGVGSGTHTSSNLELSGLPFTVATGQYSTGTIDIGKGGIKGNYMRAKQGSDDIEFFYPSESNSTQRYQMAGNQVGTGTYLIGTMSYYTTA